MINKALRYLLNNDPRKVMSKPGTVLRKMFNPVYRHVIVTLACKRKLIIVSKAKIPKNKRIIFTPTHGFREDVPFSQKIVGRQTYILCGSLPEFYESMDGWAIWLSGVIIVDRNDKASRTAAQKKMEYAMELGSDIIMYPEGVWNTSENLLIGKLFPGVYNLAQATGALIMPIALVRTDKFVYAMLGDAFDICEYERKEGLTVLRDRMATMKYELMEKYTVGKRSDYDDTQQYWEKYQDDLVAEIDYRYDFETERKSLYIDKDITEPKEAFAHLDKLCPCRNNAFLFNKRNLN